MAAIPGRRGSHTIASSHQMQLATEGALERWLALPPALGAHQRQWPNGYYRRAATRPLASPGATREELEEAQGWTLHQLRHSLLTHEAENGTNTPMLLARSRHASVRSLERYARPGPEAVARHVAQSDPAARRGQPK